MDEMINNVCPACGNPIVDDDSVITCPSCGKVYHEKCWNEKEGCITEGCPENHSAVQTEEAPANEEESDNASASTIVCSKCGTLLTEGQDFCPKCGTPRCGEKRVCQKCGTLLEDDQEYCPKCGTKYGETVSTENVPVQSGKKAIDKKKIIAIVLAVVIVIAGYFGYKRLTRPNLEKIVDEFCSEQVDENGEEYSWYRDLMYADNFLFTNPVMVIGDHGDWIKVDTNPDDLDSDDYEAIVFASYLAGEGLTEKLLEELGFSDIVLEQVNSTSAMMGVQTAESSLATASWTYHPDNGLEIIFTLK